MKLLLLTLLAGTCAAQTISPVIAECGLKCRGEFSVKNNSVLPVVVVVNTYSFRIENGKRVNTPVSDQSQVILNQTTARISPQGEHVFAYKIFCSAEPCMTLLEAGFAAGRTKEGVQVMLRLPHVVYSCKKQKGCRERTLNENTLAAAPK